MLIGFSIFEIILLDAERFRNVFENMEQYHFAGED